MKIIPASYEILTPIDGADFLRRIELAGRVCYKSESAITDESAEKFVAGIIQRGHESVIEHASFSVLFTVDRGVTHELVRHRLASYSMESTRYCNYSKDKFDNQITFIKPCYWPEGTYQYRLWESACAAAEETYISMIEHGATAEQARGVLPHSTKADVVMSANIREWRHFLKLRTDKAVHPQMREVTVPLLAELKAKVPALFNDIGV